MSPTFFPNSLDHSSYLISFTQSSPSTLTSSFPLSLPLSPLSTMNLLRHNLSVSSDPSVCREFVTRVSDCVSSGALGWSSRQLHKLHCLGVLLNCEKEDDLHAHIKDIYSLISVLVTGLQLPSEEIRGEVLFVLYKLSVLQSTTAEGEGNDILIPFCPKLLYLLGDVLLKTQNDDVRLNCIVGTSDNHIRVLVEENVADYLLVWVKRLLDITLKNNQIRTRVNETEFVFFTKLERGTVAKE